MYKLTVISGPNRGTSYAVQEGELTIGRQAGNTIVLPSSKVSKRHCVITLTEDEITIQDEGSSNGTFVNGTLVKVKKIKPGDRISVGGFIFELVESQKKSLQIAPAAGFGNSLQFPVVPPAKHGQNQNHGLNPQLAAASPGIGGAFPGMGGEPIRLSNEPPKDLKDRLLWYFEHHLMPTFYKLNFQYEWRTLCIAVLVAFIVGNLLFSVYPLLESGRETLIKETKLRAKFMARQIAEHNAPFLAAHTETKADLGITESAEGVRLAVLIDLDSRIIAPGIKLNQYLGSGDEANFAVTMRNRFQKMGLDVGATRETDDSVIAIEPVQVVSSTAGRNVVVAMAIVSIDTTLNTLDYGEMAMVYSETLIFTGILGLVLFLILYRLTLKPFLVLNDDMDKALKGDISQVTHEFRFEELNPLWELINSAIQRVPKLTDGDGPIGNLDTGPVGTDDLVGPIRMLGKIAKFGFIVFDGSKKIIFLNEAFEEISGIRPDGAMGQNIADAARDQALGPFMNDLLDRAVTGDEGVSEDFEFSGISYKMHAASIGNSGTAARCYLVAAVRLE